MYCVFSLFFAFFCICVLLYCDKCLSCARFNVKMSDHESEPSASQERAEMLAMMQAVIANQMAKFAENQEKSDSKFAENQENQMAKFAESQENQMAKLAETHEIQMANLTKIQGSQFAELQCKLLENKEMQENQFALNYAVN